jgi:polysaccharide export outer membrane protein
MLRSSWWIVGVPLLWACASGHTSPQTVTQRAHAAAELLHPGDIVRLKIWREPDLSGDFPIDETGTVVLPKLGPVKVTEVPPESLKTQLTRDYARYLTQPSIEVVLLRRIRIDGAVRTPGLYPVDATMTVSDALALAGGITPDGSKKVELFRGGDKVSGSLTQQTPLSETQLQSGDQLHVPYQSWLARNGYLAGAALSAAVTIVALLARRY